MALASPGSLRPRSWRHLEHPRRLWVLAVAVLALLGFLLYKGLSTSINYFETARQAVAERATLGSRTFNLEGTVVPGTVRQTAKGADFSVANAGVTVKVINVGSPPQLFKPGIPVVVVGHFSGSTFASNQIIVKHSADYIAAHPNRVKAASGSVQ